MTYIYYTLIPLLLLLTAIVLLRKRGMKSEPKICPFCGEEDCKYLEYLLPQEKNRSSTEERN